MQLISGSVLCVAVPRFGDRVQQWLDEHDVTVAAYARRIGASDSTMRRWLDDAKRTRPPKRDDLERLARGGIPLVLLQRWAIEDMGWTEALEFTSPALDLPEHLQVLLASITALPEAEQRRIVQGVLPLMQTIQGITDRLADQ